MYGRIVTSVGSQRNVPVTSASGFSELEIMTYTGIITKPVSRVRKIRRDHRNERGGAMGDAGEAEVAGDTRVAVGELAM
ncbi:hypothetical protein GCM10027073_64440 [Streptomyces chlorus]